MQKVEVKKKTRKLLDPRKDKGFYINNETGTVVVSIGKINTDRSSFIGVCVCKGRDGLDVGVYDGQWSAEKFVPFEGELIVSNELV